MAGTAFSISVDGFTISATIPVPGCTDDTACNYDASVGANTDDGSCLYPQEATITEIQGTGDTSPLEGILVETSGIVTGVSYSGFFIQDGVGPWTGLWVYTSSPAVAVWHWCPWCDQALATAVESAALAAADH